MSNLQIREAAMRSGVKMWEIADAIGITDCHFSRKLRKELPAQEQENLIKVINTIATNRKREG